MELFATRGNPIPSAAIVSPIQSRDGLSLRVARWAAGQPRGTVTIAIGRSEFIEEYFPIVRALLARDFDTVIMDWRGQGQSDRECPHERRGHISSFSAYRRDLEALEVQVLERVARRPWYALGHSMGATILLEQAHDGESPFERLVLSAPMIGIPLRYKKTIKRFVRTADGLGFGSRVIPGGSEASVLTTRLFTDNVLTADPAEYERLATITKLLPKLAIGAPTIRWLARAFDVMDRFEHPLYAVETSKPILIVAAGADRIVDTAATERFAIRLKAGRCLTIPDARHQVIMERPGITAQFWAAFDAFIPGETRLRRPKDAQTPKIVATRTQTV